MVLILTKRGEQSVTEVSLWLQHYNMPYTRINVEEIDPAAGVFQISDQNIAYEIIYNNAKIQLHEITSVWFWHGILQTFPSNKLEIGKAQINAALNKYSRKEYNSFLEGFYYLLENKKSLGKFHTYQINKIESLRIASLLGLKVPNTLITSSKVQLKSFHKNNNRVVTKGIHGVFRAILSNQIYTNYTEIITGEFIEGLPDRFHPSLFQEYLNKKYELRIFFLEDQLYSAAIFSQLDEMTTVDFRKYNYKKPNRIVPFKLPDDIEVKLKKLMNHLQLNTGSIDMVVTTDNQFIFLEVNPVGQYGFVSDWCNYYLDKKIANYLKFQITT